MYCLIDQLAGEVLYLGIGAACMAMDSVRAPEYSYFFSFSFLSSLAELRALGQFY